MIPTRRQALALLASLSGTATLPRRARAAGQGLKLGPPQPFSFETLKAHAADIASRPYAPAPRPDGSVLDAIDYDEGNAIQYRDAAALFGDRPGGTPLRLFHMTRHARDPVSIFVVDKGVARQVVYSPDLFDMPAASPARRMTSAAGFAGFRAMGPDGAGDWVAFLGASYFRAAAPFDQYGLSVRGLAIDTGQPYPEEFPAFTALWLEEDAGGQLVVHALLDGPSVCGAYRIVHERGKPRRTDKGVLRDLVQDIEAALVFRKPVARLGIAPITSMYWYGMTERSPAQDWRPQIHDSDGLSMWTGEGRRVWRPLVDPPHVTVSPFADTAPRGFGLMQRDHNFEDYQDDAVAYDKRPSAWVEPVGDWGEGAVQLVEIPTTSEIEDNIVAFWTPAAPVKAGDRQSWRYRLHWTDREPGALGVARIIASRTGRGGRPGSLGIFGRRKFVVDFAGGPMGRFSIAIGVAVAVEASRGKIVDAGAFPILGGTRWRMIFDVDLEGQPLSPGEALDLRAWLHKDGEVLSETWVYRVFSI